MVSVRESNGARVRPLPMNTVAMLKLASQSLGMGPKEATVYAERLYLKGYISYPRTETTAYPEHYNLLFVPSKTLSLAPPWSSSAPIPAGERTSMRSSPGDCAFRGEESMRAIIPRSRRWVRWIRTCFLAENRRCMT